MLLVYDKVSGGQAVVLNYVLTIVKLDKLNILRKCVIACYHKFDVFFRGHSSVLPLTLMS